MKKILIIGATGQIGSELSMELRSRYGNDNVIVGYIHGSEPKGILKESGPCEVVDVTDGEMIASVVEKYHIDTIYNLAALLSVVAESKPKLLSDYYFLKYGVDTRAVRFPGLISNVTLPGGGTTDYAVDIYYSAVKGEKFICPLKPGTFMDMMYMPDALNAAISLMEADPSRLIHRNAFNIASMSFAPENIYEAIRKEIPSFEMEYAPDPLKQSIADSWPDSMDDSCARAEWDWKPEYDLESMTSDMISKLKVKLSL